MNFDNNLNIIKYTMFVCKPHLLNIQMYTYENIVSKNLYPKLRQLIDYKKKILGNFYKNPWQQSELCFNRRFIKSGKHIDF